MTSKKQTEANRKNAKRSTGPRTDAGKAASSRNALRHGLLSEASTLPDEDPAEFDAHAAAIKRDLEPVGGLEERYVQRIAELLWRLARLRRLEAGVFENGHHQREASDARGELGT